MSGLTWQEEQNYGPEFVEIMRKVAAETAQPLNQEIQNLRQAMSYVQQETGSSFLERMNRELTALVGDWQALNRHGPFIAWSQLPDVFSGELRKTLMQRAWDSGDPHRVAEFFRAWAALPDSRPPPAGGASYSPYLPSGTPQRREANHYTPDQISRFYRDVVAGRWKNREAERAALDRDIQIAGREGKVIGADGRPVSYVQK